MAGSEAHQKYLHWTGGWNSEPVWPGEPDVNVIKSLAKAHLNSQLRALGQDALPDVAFFAQGGFNKLYEIRLTGHGTSYLFRVALPIEPFYKTESEVATISYLRANTTIPVPQVYAWNSNSKNELGFEWILMEKLDGVPLYDLWPRKVPWESKLRMTSAIAGFVKQLRICRFDHIGGLYFQSAIDTGEQFIEKPMAPTTDMIGPAAKDQQHTGGNSLDSWTAYVRSILRSLFSLSLVGGRAMPESQDDDGRTASATTNPIPTNENTVSVENRNQPGFCVDRVFDPVFFKGSRSNLPGNRGAYRSSLEWLSAEIQIQLEWIKQGPVEGDEDYDDDFAEDAPTMAHLCQEYLDLLPTIFNDDKGTDHFTLYHSDLNAANILVDPETFDITGIVDWEMINVVPAWRASDRPKLLDYLAPDEVEEPPLPSDDVSENDTAWELRDRWEHKILREYFDNETALNKQGPQEGDDVETKAKLDCYGFISELTGMWSWSERWLKIYKRTGKSVNQADWMHPTYCDEDEE